MKQKNKKQWQTVFNKFCKTAPRVTDDERVAWKSKLLEDVFREAFFKYIKDSFQISPDLDDEKTFKRDDATIWEELDKICRESVDERVKMGHFLTVIRPFELSTATLRHFGNVSYEESIEIEKGHESFVNKPIASERTIVKEIKKMMTTEPQLVAEDVQRQSFFEEHDFFKGFEKELNLLGYDNGHQLYRELHNIAIAFDVPDVKNDLVT